MYRALFREIPASGKTPKKQHLEIWKKNILWKLFDLTSFDLHGDVNTDSETILKHLSFSMFFLFYKFMACVLLFLIQYNVSMTETLINYEIFQLNQELLKIYYNLMSL